MRASRFTRVVLLLASLAIAGLCVVDPATAQSDDEIDALNLRVQELYKSAKYADAIAVAEQYAAAAKRRHGEGHTAYATAISWLGHLYKEQGRYADAEPLMRGALKIDEASFGPDHPKVAIRLSNLAQLLQATNRLADAEPLMRRALKIDEATLGWEHPHFAADLNDLAELYREQGHYGQAEPLYTRALAIRENMLGPEHPDVAQSLNNLAALYDEQGRYAEAEPLKRRVLAICERALGREHPLTALSLNNLGELLKAEGRYAEAEPILKRSLAIRDRALGPEHPLTAQSLSNLAELYRLQGRHTEAKPLCDRALAIYEKALGPDHPHTARGVNDLALLFDEQGRFAEAEPLYRRALAIDEKSLDPAHPTIAIALNNLAQVYGAQGRYVEAEPLNKRALAIRENALGPEHPSTAAGLNNLAVLYSKQERYDEAEPLYKRALEISEKALPHGHPHIASSLNNLAELYYARRDWDAAADHARRASTIIIERARRVTRLEGGASDTTRSELSRHGSQFQWLMLAGWRLAEQRPAQRAALSEETFGAAQWTAQTSAAAALAQMAARLAKGEDELSRLVRETQNLSDLWQQLDKQIIIARSAPTGLRDTIAEQTLAARLAETDRQLLALNTQLANSFPNYMALARPEPLSIKTTREQLRLGEALVQFAFGLNNGFAWVVTKTDSRWVRIEPSIRTLTERVAALRCGLDVSAWASFRCSDLLSIRYTEMDQASGNPPPFDLTRAHDLYRDLFGQIEDLIKDKQLLIVPAGPLTSLPFHVLVTEEPKATISNGIATHREVAWLGTRQAITTLPSVSSLKALREFAKTSQAQKPYVAFGNPLLEGVPANDRHARLAMRAKRKQVCSSQDRALGIAVAAPADAPAPITFVMRGGTADIAAVKQLPPLPDTADEICEAAASLGASDADVYLGAKTREGTLKAMSDAGRLKEYRVVHFATHGLVADETNKMLRAYAEPALVMTPPDTGSEEDDGLLTASEVAGLKLDADWVILSACNTAAGEKGNGEALSGLARAFFYAGARALVVSHWYVDSFASKTLISMMLTQQKAHPGIGRAEALRQAMVNFMMTGDAQAAHPAFWAPFVVVGEGGR